MQRLKPFLPLFCLVAAMVICYALLNLYFHIFQLPYIWDELGVYSRAAIYLYEHSLSLLPSAIPDELSRGHPNFVAFYVAIWFKLFGCQPLVAHMAMAAINIAAFVFIYLILQPLMKSWLAAAGTFMIFLQPFILAQSTLVLPEIPLLFATAVAIYCYLKHHFWLTACALILALQIKESALILPIAFYLSHLWVNRQFKFTPIAQLLLVPILSFVVFIGVQKLQRGYFFYPLHTSLLSFDAYYINNRWHEFRDFLLWEQGHYIVWLAWGILLAMVLDFKRIKWRQNTVILPLIFIGGVCFSALNYYLSRYTLFFMVPLYCFTIISICKKDPIRLKNSMYPLSLILLGTISGLLHLKGGKDFKDTDFSYTSHVNNLQTTLTALDSSLYAGRTLRMDFPLAACYWGNKNGYARKADYTIVYDKKSYAEFAVFTYPGNMSDTSSLPANAKLTQTLKNGYAYARIYRLLDEKDYQ